MAKRRAYQPQGYGSAPMPKPPQSGMPLPPPPDGQPPARLPIGDPTAMMQQPQPEPMDDPNAAIIALLQQMGRL